LTELAAVQAAFVGAMQPHDTLIDNLTGEIDTANSAWQRHRRIVDLRNRAEQTFLELGEELYWFEAEKQYKALNYETFEAYLADPEVDIGRSIAFMLKGVYEKFVLDLKVQPVGLLEAGHSKLDLVRPYVTPDNVDEWVDKAASLSRSDLRAELTEAFPPPESPPLPEGKYAVLYADPPWSYSNSGFNQSAASIYPTMTVEEICDLPVSDLAGDECVLLMWATSPLLPEAFRVMEAWGFEYKASRVWIKNRSPGIGWFVNTRHELLLIGVKGQGHPKEKLDSIIEAPVTRHSAKPTFLYDEIEWCYDGPYVELFARNEREGWASWGNEI